MGYYQRKAGEGIAVFFACGIIVLLLGIGPYIFGKAVGGVALGWTFEVVYLVAIGTAIALGLRKAVRARLLARKQRVETAALTQRLRSSDPAIRAEALREWRAKNPAP